MAGPREVAEDALTDIRSDAAEPSVRYVVSSDDMVGGVLVYSQRGVYEGMARSIRGLPKGQSTLAVTGSHR